MPPEVVNRAVSEAAWPVSKVKRSLLRVVRVNGKINAREVRVIGAEGDQIGIMSLADALHMAKSLKLDLVQISDNVEPPICRLIDFGKYLDEFSKKNKKSD